MLKKYDKLLFLEHKLDLKKFIKRKSQFYKTINYEVLELTNQYFWSWRWIVDKLKRMDSRKIDFFSWAIQDSLDRRKKGSKDNRLHKEVATFIQEWNKIVI